MYKFFPEPYEYWGFLYLIHIIDYEVVEKYVKLYFIFLNYI